MKRFVVFSLVIVSVLISALAQAHSRSQSFSSWTLDGNRLHLLFNVKSREVTRLPLLEGQLTQLDELLTVHLSNNLAVSANGNPCVLTEAISALSAREGYSRAEAEFNCGAGGAELEKGLEIRALSIKADVFFAVAPSHIHYARIGLVGDMPQEYIFSDAQRIQELDISEQGIEAKTGFLNYLKLGVEHILIGADHLIFLLGLILVSRRLRDMAWMVTGFTLGHSITLSLAVMGVVTPNISAIESLIGFTVLLVAAESVVASGGSRRGILLGGVCLLLVMGLASMVYPMAFSLLALCGLALFASSYLLLSGEPSWRARLHPLMTIVFGFIHGFGFADVLMEIGLPQEQMLWALFGFNVGVELGQLLFVAMVACAIFLLVRLSPQGYRNVQPWLACVICGVGGYWFLGRALLGW